jgi:hypothetical protein
MPKEYSDPRLEAYKKHIDEKFEPLFKILRLLPEINKTLDDMNNMLDNRHKIVVKDTKLYNELHGR